MAYERKAGDPACNFSVYRDIPDGEEAWAEIMDWLDDDSRMGLYWWEIQYRDNDDGSMGDKIEFMFSHLDTAFEFRVRFG